MRSISLPCDSSYLEPTQREKEYRRVASLILYIQARKLLDIHPTTLYAIAVSAENVYGGSEDFTTVLCDIIKGMTTEEREGIVYNAHDKRARDLADWWDNHQAADDKREAEEQAAVRKARLVKSAKSKLTQEEWDAITR